MISVVVLVVDTVDTLHLIGSCALLRLVLTRAVATSRWLIACVLEMVKPLAFIATPDVKVIEDPAQGEIHKYLITSSVDGCMYFV